MARFKLHDPFRELHGMLSKKNGRVEYKYLKEAEVPYTVLRDKLSPKERRERKKQRAESESDSQRAAKAKFKAVSISTRARMKDATRSAADEEAFRQQDAYPTLYGYVFSQEWANYEG